MSHNSSDKLDALRRLDRFRKWHSLDDERRCLQCGKIIIGRQIDVNGGGTGPLRAHCPTENCTASPLDWALPEDTYLVRLPNERDKQRQLPL